MSSYVNLTYTLVDGAGYEWDIQSDGAVYDGTDNAFDYALDPGYGSFINLAEWDEDARTLRTMPGIMGDVVFTRQVFASTTEGYARFFDTLTNYTDESITYTYSSDTNFGAGSASVIETSSGDGILTDKDKWFLAIDTDGSSPVAGILTGDGKASKPTAIRQYSDDIDLDYTVTLAPGESTSFLFFAAQGGNRKEVAGTFKELLDLPVGTLEGLTAEEINRISNWKLPDASLDLRGTKKGDLLQGSDAGDSLSGLDGNDTLLGNGGNDVLRGGFGSDFLQGHGGRDRIFGDGTVDLVTSTAETTLSNGEQLAVSLSMADAGSGRRTEISGFISREAVTSENIDLVFVIDISGSTSTSFVGNRAVGDANGDGYANTVLDAEIEAFEALHRSILEDAQLPDVNITVIPFESDARAPITFRAGADQDGDGVEDIVEAVRGLTDAGNTNYTDALETAYTHFAGSEGGQQVMYFLSDGFPTSGSGYTVPVQKLLDLGVKIQTFGVGAGSSEADLDLVDDLLDNDSTTIVLDPSDLRDTLLDPGIGQTDIQRLEVYKNGSLFTAIDPGDLALTPFGLRYFELTVTGLRAKKADVIEVRAIANDSTSTVLTTSQKLEHLKGRDKGDTLIGNAGADLLDGGDGNDILIGGRGADTLRGGAGKDTASYEDANTGVVVNLGKLSANRGDARGDSYASIEILEGSRFDDILRNDNAGRTLNGGDGNDLLFGGGKSDVIHGGAGRDELVGKAGADKFVFKRGDGVDTIRDFETRGKKEVIDLRDFDINRFGKLDDLAKVKKGDIIFTFGDGDKLILEDVKIGALNADDFLL